MTSGQPILVSLASLALSIYVFFDQRKMKRSDVFESRWFRLLDHLKTMKFASGFESDFVGGLCLTLGFAERDGDISLQDVADRLSRAGRLVGGQHPMVCMERFKHLLLSEKRNRLISALFSIEASSPILTINMLPTHFIMRFAARTKRPSCS
jgi:hypothetical protein